MPRSTAPTFTEQQENGCLALLGSIDFDPVHIKLFELGSKATVHRCKIKRVFLRNLCRINNSILLSKPLHRSIGPQNQTFLHSDPTQHSISASDGFQQWFIFLLLFSDSSALGGLGGEELSQLYVLKKRPNTYSTSDRVRASSRKLFLISRHCTNRE